MGSRSVRVGRPIIMKKPTKILFYRSWAKEFGITEEELIKQIKDLIGIK